MCTVRPPKTRISSLRILDRIPRVLEPCYDASPQYKAFGGCVHVWSGSASVKMDIAAAYSIALGALLTVFIGWHLAAECTRWRQYLLTLLRKYISQKLIVKRQNGTSDVSIGIALSIVLFVAANAIGAALSVTTIAELSHRLSMLCTINLVPLFLGGRTSILASKLCGLSLPTYGLLHRWMGRVFLCEAILHGLLELALANWTISVLEIAVSPDKPEHLSQSAELTQLIDPLCSQYARCTIYPLHPPSSI